MECRLGRTAAPARRQRISGRRRQSSVSLAGPSSVPVLKPLLHARQRGLRFVIVLHRSLNFVLPSLFWLWRVWLQALTASQNPCCSPPFTLAKFLRLRYRTVLSVNRSAMPLSPFSDRKQRRNCCQPTAPAGWWKPGRRSILPSTSRYTH